MLSYGNGSQLKINQRHVKATGKKNKEPETQWEFVLQHPAGDFVEDVTRGTMNVCVEWAQRFKTRIDAEEAMKKVTHLANVVRVKAVNPTKGKE